jgi:glucose-6-phosphate 1-dehydrogenase
LNSQATSNAPRSTPPCLMVIFGASGDLSKRKLLPAIVHLKEQGFLPDNFGILGVARPDMDDDAYRQKVRTDFKDLGLQDDPQLLDALLQRTFYISGDLDNHSTYEAVQKRLAEIEPQLKTLGNRLFYLATLPSAFASIVQALGNLGLTNEASGNFARVIVEKPFGSSLSSAHHLNDELQAVLKEKQIYRIDHYLGKETVQNILALRFGNTILEPLWNRRYIDHIQITAAETLGVEQRGPFYEGAGALRDMVSNHLFQLLALTAMEPPVSFEAEAVRDEKMKAIRSVKTFTPEQVLTQAVRGQYGAGNIGGRPVVGYRSEERVSPESSRETFAALKLSIDNWRWAGVPFYLRTGKRLSSRCTEIAIQFKEPPLLLFKDTAVKQLEPNKLIIQIQPEESIRLSFGAKIPGPGLRLGEVAMDFDYEKQFGASPNTGYETLLYDCLIGDATQFQRADMAEASWMVMDSILDVWEALHPVDFPNYAAGSAGPDAAQALMAKDGRHWRPLL